MTQDEIIVWAKEFGLQVKPPSWGYSDTYTIGNIYVEHLEAFAKLVAEKALAQPEQEPVKWSDYEPDGMHHNKPQKRPQNCGTGYCSCIECVMEPPQRTWVGLTGLEQKELMAMTARDAVFATEAKLKERNT